MGGLGSGKGGRRGTRERGWDGMVDGGLCLEMGCKRGTREGKGRRGGVGAPRNTCQATIGSSKTSTHTATKEPHTEQIFS